MEIDDSPISDDDYVDPNHVKLVFKTIFIFFFEINKILITFKNRYLNSK